MDRFRKKAKALRASQTPAEARLWSALRNRKLDRWKFRRQHPVDCFIVDFVTIAGKLVVEVDGATHSMPAEIEYDKKRTAILESLGFHVLRVSNEDVFKNLDGVIDAIFAELNPDLFRH